LSSYKRLAIAFDIGTTTIAGALIDTESGARLAMTGCLNPQRELGADVVSRLQAAVSSPDTRERLTRLINLELERLTGELLSAAGIGVEELGRIAFAGNPTMEHFLLGLPVKSLAFPPYRPLFTAGKSLNTLDIGWNAAVAAYLFPLPGGFVGGDVGAFLYGAGAGSRESGTGDRLFLDLGTNGELALTHGETIFATSAAAGPAFEGGNLACGMAALPGAISMVEVERDRIHITTIGGGPPIGICGSGVIGAVAGLLKADVIDATGRLLAAGEIPFNLANSIRQKGGEVAFVLYRDALLEVCLSQRDIRQVQLAKAAIRAGMEVLRERADIAHEEIVKIVLTGSFGAVLDPAGLEKIGIFTGSMAKNVSFVREGALLGVEKALRIPGGLAAVERLATSVKVIPLSGTPAFEKCFLEQMNFPTAK
jgi:uncharacterized 2Fe-2S/4Fe-4S cluster protein (DUF4445 family)